MSEITQIAKSGGFVSKKELKNKVFQSSSDKEREFRRSIQAYTAYSPEFAERYAPYHLKKLVPTPIVRELLEHMEVEFEFV